VFRAPPQRNANRTRLSWPAVACIVVYGAAVLAATALGVQAVLVLGALTGQVALLLADEADRKGEAAVALRTLLGGMVRRAALIADYGVRSLFPLGQGDRRVGLGALSQAVARLAAMETHLAFATPNAPRIRLCLLLLLVAGGAAAGALSLLAGRGGGRSLCCERGLVERRDLHGLPRRGLLVLLAHVARRARHGGVVLPRPVAGPTRLCMTSSFHSASMQPFSARREVFAAACRVERMWPVLGSSGQQTGVGVGMRPDSKDSTMLAMRLAQCVDPAVQHLAINRG